MRSEPTAWGRSRQTGQEGYGGPEPGTPLTLQNEDYAAIGRAWSEGGFYLIPVLGLFTVGDCKYGLPPEYSDVSVLFRDPLREPIPMMREIPFLRRGFFLGREGEREYNGEKTKRRRTMLAYTYVEKGKFELREKEKPVLLEPGDAIIKVTLASICTSDLHIRNGSVPRAVPGITVGHEMVGIVEQVGSAVTTVKPGDRVTVNVETFCGHCYFCEHGWVNNCTDPNGGWALGCRINGGQAEYVRVPYADQGLDRIPDNVTDRQALFVGDILATGYWAAEISEIGPEDTVLIIGAGPTGLCTLQCVLTKKPRRVIVCDINSQRLDFVKQHHPGVLTTTPDSLEAFVKANSDHGGADAVLEVAGTEGTFRLAWQNARPNAIVTVVALYDRPQTLPLPDMYGKNLIFKTGGVDGCHCAETLRLIADGTIDTTPLITHTYPLKDIEAAYRLFENREDNVIKVAVEC